MLGARFRLEELDTPPYPRPCSLSGGLLPGRPVSFERRGVTRALTPPRSRRGTSLG